MPWERGACSVSLDLQISVFYKGHCSQGLSWSGSSCLSRRDTKFIFLLQLNLIHKLLGKVTHFLDEKVELKVVSALFMESLIVGTKLVASSSSCWSMLIGHSSSQVSTITISSIRTSKHFVSPEPKDCVSPINSCYFVYEVFWRWVRKSSSPWINNSPASALTAEMSELFQAAPDLF